MASQFLLENNVAAPADRAENTSLHTHRVPGCPWAVPCEAALGTHLLLWFEENPTVILGFCCCEMGLSVAVVFYTSDSRETHSWSRAGIPQEVTAVGSLQQHWQQCELSQMGAALHDLQGAGEEKLQIQSLSWLLVGVAGQTLGVLHSPNPQLPLPPQGAVTQRLEWMSFSDSLLPLQEAPVFPSHVPLWRSLAGCRINAMETLMGAPSVSVAGSALSPNVTGAGTDIGRAGKSQGRTKWGQQPWGPPQW